MSDPLQIGCIGVSGYPTVLMNALDQHTTRDQTRIAAVDVSMSSPAEKMAEVLSRHQTQQVRGVDALMAFPGLDAMLVATSIDSHLPYTVAALERGMHVHCEKPVTATIQDALAMIAARDKADRVVHIGFQDTYSRTAAWAKRKILAGEIGRVKQVRVSALWSRDDAYYRRNDWAGGLKRDGRWVLDSPANNALSHQINMALYLTGATMDESNVATSIEAELYRARPITNADTCTMRCQTSNGPEILILLTHACTVHNAPIVEITGERGAIRRKLPPHAELIRDGDVVEACAEGEPGMHGLMVQNFLDHIHGEVDRSMCEIENALEVTRVINGASQATAVVDVAAKHHELKAARPGHGSFKGIVGIDAVFDRCLKDFALPSEVGAPWARPGGALSLENYVEFTGPPAGSS